MSEPLDGGRGMGNASPPGTIPSVLHYDETCVSIEILKIHLSLKTCYFALGHTPSVFERAKIVRKLAALRARLPRAPGELGTPLQAPSEELCRLEDDRLIAATADVPPAPAAPVLLRAPSGAGRRGRRPLELVLGPRASGPPSRPSALPAAGRGGPEEAASAGRPADLPQSRLAIVIGRAPRKLAPQQADARLRAAANMELHAASPPAAAPAATAAARIEDKAARLPQSEVHVPSPAAAASAAAAPARSTGRAARLPAVGRGETAAEDAARGQSTLHRFFGVRRAEPAAAIFVIDN